MPSPSKGSSSTSRMRMLYLTHECGQSSPRQSVWCADAAASYEAARAIPARQTRTPLRRETAIIVISFFAHRDCSLYVAFF